MLDYIDTIRLAADLNEDLHRMFGIDRHRLRIDLIDGNSSLSVDELRSTVVAEPGARRFLGMHATVVTFADLHRCIFCSGNVQRTVHLKGSIDLDSVAAIELGRKGSSRCNANNTYATDCCEC